MVCSLYAQTKPDSAFHQKAGLDTLKLNLFDSLKRPSDTLPLPPKKSKNKIEATVTCLAKDSLVFDFRLSKASLYRTADVTYKENNLKAGYIEMNFKNSVIEALPLTDSAMVEKEVPEMTQGSTVLHAKKIQFNFITEKGVIEGITTKEGEGFLYGSKVKKLKDGTTNVRNGWYTTCDHVEHPHFAIKYSKAKIIPDDKVVTGPVYMVIEDVPLPIVLPFGMFPNKRGRSSGLLPIAPGEENERGFSLKGGYYFGINDYFDAKVYGEVFSSGSWVLNPQVNYRKRYKYSGQIDLNYSIRKKNTKYDPDYFKKTDFKVTWSHIQDPKAHPNQSFSASVNVATGTQHQNNPTSYYDYANNILNSSISYGYRFNNVGNLRVSATHNQNVQTHEFNINFPQLDFSLDPLYPFRRKSQVGSQKWYEKINVNYSLTSRTELHTVDSLLFSEDFFDKLNSGVQQDIKINSSYKLLKYITFSIPIRYTERWYFKTIEQQWVPGVTIGTQGRVVVDTAYGFWAARDYSVSSNLSTTIYGIKQFQKGAIRAVRHVITPSVGLSYIPDFRSQYYKSVQNSEEGSIIYYAPFLGTPGSPPQGNSGMVTFSLGNNLEMKVKSKKDTVTGVKKIVLIDNLSVNTSYDLIQKRLSPLSMNARTRLLNKINITYNASWSFYALDSLGLETKTFQYNIDKKLLRFQNSTWQLSFDYNLNSKSGSRPSQSTQSPLGLAPVYYTDWSNPWDFYFAYTFSYNTRANFLLGHNQSDVIQTLSGNGNINVTPKWKFGMGAGYDLKAMSLTYANVSISRDLHCWEMHFNWTPFGYTKSWSFVINVKASVLQDLKVQKKKSMWDR